MNPIRYRGYYFDRETNLYYLNSRYYNPQWCRFISPADISTLNPQAINGLNLYAYKHNQPIKVGLTKKISGETTTKHLYSFQNANHYSNIGSSMVATQFFYNILGTTSNIFAIINGIEAAEYLSHIHGNPPPIKWFLDNVSKLGKVSGYLGYVSALVDGAYIYNSTNDANQAFLTVIYDIAGMHVASNVGAFIGGILAGPLGSPLGAIAGTLVIILIESFIQNFKEDVVNFFDEIVDTLLK